MKRVPVAILAFGLAALSCVTVTVANLSLKHNAVILVTLPDEAYGAIKLGPSQSIDYTATDGGAYTVEVLPGKEYLAALQTLWNELVAAMALNPTLSPGPDGENLFRKLANMQAEIDALPRTRGSCSGKTPPIDTLSW